VRLLAGRLERIAQIYGQEFGVDVRQIEGAGAAGGLAGALAALGGRLVPGFDLVADELDLYDRVRAADVVITGEGRLDAQSFEGKVVGRVQELSVAAGNPVAALVGSAEPDVADRIVHASLVELFGTERAMNEPLWCIERAAGGLLEQLAADAVRQVRGSDQET
jgi:glycerate kinase